MDRNRGFIKKSVLGRREDPCGSCGSGPDWPCLGLDALDVSHVTEPALYGLRRTRGRGFVEMGGDYLNHVVDPASPFKLFFCIYLFIYYY